MPPSPPMHSPSLLIKAILQPPAQRPQALPPHILVGLGHELHDPRLEPQPLQLAPLLGHLAHQAANVVARNGQHRLVVVPRLRHNVGQLAQERAVLKLEDLARVLGPEHRVAVRRRPPQVSRVDLGHVLVERGLGLGVFLEQVPERAQVLAEVGVGELPGLEVLQEGGEAGEDGGREERVLVGGEEVQQGRDEEARGLFFWRQAEELCVEKDNVVFTEGVS